ncbi:MAG: glycosyltransferase family 2 protein [Spirochaetia bacterium]|nr:glycosyltransferase family 2 protein [Spirochaetia bacterium]
MGKDRGRKLAKISGVIISYNEEKKIGDCIKSMLSVVDEVLLVDSLSADRTVDIAKKFKVRVIAQKFLGYIEQKNFAISKAKYDWILSLDCDERLSGELSKSIESIKNDLPEKGGFIINRKTFYVYRWFNYCFYPDKRVRLFNRKTASWGGVNPHDKVIVQRGVIQPLKGDILHYSFDSIADHIKTLEKFSWIGAQEIIKKNKKISAFTPILRAFATFIRMYLLKKGFLDGYPGFVACVLSGVHVFAKYNHVYFENKKSIAKVND